MGGAEHRGRTRRAVLGPLVAAAGLLGRSARAGIPAPDLRFPSLQAALAAAASAEAARFRVAGFARPGDGGAAPWRLSARGEGSPGSRRHALSGAWFELDAGQPAPEMLGGAADWDGRTGRDNGPILAELIAWAAGRPIRLGAGRYLASPVSIQGPVSLGGQGAGRTVLIQADAPSLGGRGLLYADSGGPDRSIAGVTLRDLALDGRVETRGFDEFTHLVSLNGVSEVLIERVAFLGFRGDGLYLGSGVRGGEERHNRRIAIRDCRFDGRNRNNRNCISVLDADGLTIRNCSFLNSSRPDMPGAIDFEPNPGSRRAVVQDVEIAGNRFQDVGGAVAVICFHFAPDVPAPSRLRVLGNTSRRSGRAFLYAHLMQPWSVRSGPTDLVVTGNDHAGGRGAPFLLDGVRGARLSQNRWSDLPGAAQIGVLRLAQDVQVADRFARVGSLRTPYAVGVGSVRGLRLGGAAFIDCGAPVIGGENLFFRPMAGNKPAQSEQVDTTGATSTLTDRRRTVMSLVSPLHRRVS